MRPGQGMESLVSHRQAAQRRLDGCRDVLTGLAACSGLWGCSTRTFHELLLSFAGTQMS